jgi:hypothetical protein
VLVLVVTFLCAGTCSFLGSSPFLLFAEDDEQQNDDQLSRDTNDENPAPDETNDEEGDGDRTIVNEEEDGGEAEGAAEREDMEEVAKTFSCPKCGYSSDEAGDCPACNMSLAEENVSADSDSNEVRGRSSVSDGDSSVSTDSDGNIDAVSGGNSTKVGADGSVSAGDGQGNSVNIHTGGIDINTGGY